jgi:hypothetical protein
MVLLYAIHQGLSEVVARFLESSFSRRQDSEDCGSNSRKVRHRNSPNEKPFLARFVISPERLVSWRSWFHTLLYDLDAFSLPPLLRERMHAYNPLLHYAYAQWGMAPCRPRLCCSHASSARTYMCSLTWGFLATEAGATTRQMKEGEERDSLWMPTKHCLCRLPFRRHSH